MAMNNPANLGKYSGSHHPQKNQFQTDPLFTNDKFDFSLLNKQDGKFDMENLNDIFAANPSLNPFLDKNNPNADLFLNPSAAQNLSLDPNLLYNFPSANPQGQPGSNAPAGDHPGMYPPNRNMMFPGGMPNQALYEDFMKAQNSADYLMGDKNLLGQGMLADNMGLLDNQLLFSGIDQDLAQFGQLPFANPLLLNSMYGGEFNLQNLFLPPNMSGFGIDDLYGLQMPGGMPGGNMPGNMGGMPGSNNPRGAQNQNFQGNMGNRPSPHPQGNKGGSQGGNRPTNPAGFPDLKVEGSAQQQRNQANANRPAASNQGQAPQQPASKAGNPPQNKNPQGHMNQAHKQQNQAASLTKQDQFDMNKQGAQNPPAAKNAMQSNFDANQQQAASMRFNMTAPNAGTTQEKQAAQNQPQAAKTPQQNAPQKPMHSWPDPAAMMNPDIAKAMQASMKPGPGNPADFDSFFGKGFMDPLMFGKNPPDGMLDPFGLTDDLFSMPQIDAFNKLKEKNKYERSLKIERYKNKKRNWQKKIAYECRRKVANTRLRIKGRFISKKDCDKIVEFVGEQEEAFNDKKNLNLDFITSKLNVQADDEDAFNILRSKPNVSKSHLLNKIDEILTNNKTLTSKNVTHFRMVGETVKGLLRTSKKIFKIQKRSEPRKPRGTDEQVSMSYNAEFDIKPNQGWKPNQMKNETSQNPAFGMEFNAPMPGNAGGIDTQAMDNMPFMRVSPQDLERMAEDPRLASIPKDALEAMMFNMMNMGYMGPMGNMGNMGMNMNMGQGGFGRKGNFNG